MKNLILFIMVGIIINGCNGPQSATGNNTQQVNPNVYVTITPSLYANQEGDIYLAFDTNQIMDDGYQSWQFIGHSMAGASKILQLAPGTYTVFAFKDFDFSGGLSRGDQISTYQTLIVSNVDQVVNYEIRFTW